MSESHWFNARRTPQVFYFEQDGPKWQSYVVLPQPPKLALVK